MNAESVCCRWQLKSLSLTSLRTLTNTLVSAPTPLGVEPGPTKHWDQERLAYVLAIVYLATLTAHRTLHPPQDKTRTTLTMDDLSAALSDYGINARKPEFYL